MSLADGEPWPTRVVNDETRITIASFLHVLTGVVVATKALEKHNRALVQWFRQYQAEASDPLLDTTATADPITLDYSLPFNKWFTDISSSPGNSKEGVRQLAQVTLGVALLREKARRGQEVGTASLDLVWSLIHSAIVSAQDNELQFSINRSAQGFLAVPLCSLVENGRIDELWRFHTWLPDGQRGVSDVCIHAHQPFGQSWILLGSGIDCTFHAEVPDNPSLATHAAYEASYTGADRMHSGSAYQTHQISSTIRNTGRLLKVTSVSQKSHSRDMSYTVPGGVYHSSNVPGSKLHATLFVFDAHRGYDDSAAVVGPKNGTEYLQPRDPAGVTPKALAQMVDATRRWEQAHVVTLEGINEHDTVMAYYRFFRGLGLLQAGRQEDALKYLSPTEGLTPMQAFAREPSQRHREYMEKLVRIGANLDMPNKASDDM